MNRRQKIIVSVVGIFIVLLALVGITYGYFLTRIQGNTNVNSITVSTANLILEYADGNGRVAPTEKIYPGYIVTKTFSVTNKGNSEIDYIVVLEDVINEISRHPDLVYSLTCGVYSKSDINIDGTLKDGATKTGGCNGVNETNFPRATDLEIVVRNIVSVDYAHYYELTVHYKETNTDQSVDMGKTFEAHVNIKDPNEYNPYHDKETLAYNIINNSITGSNGTKYRTIPLTKVAEETNIYNLNVFSNVPLSEVADLSYEWYDENDVYYENSFDSCSNEMVGIKIVDFWGCFDGSLLVTGCNGDEPIVEAPLTAKESTLSLTDDTYTETTGIKSYYFRGNVEDNYVNFSNKCWRIVRIEGDGSIKLILESLSPCSESMESNFLIGKADWGYKYENNNYIGDYKNSTTGMKNALTTWLNATNENGVRTNITTSAEKLLKNEEWCLGSVTNTYNYDYNSTFELLRTTVEQNHASDTKFYFETGRNLGGKGIIPNATLICNGETDSSKIGALTADEVVFAGGTRYTGNNNFDYYLQKDNYSWWTLSRGYFDGTGDSGYSMSSSGFISEGTVSNYGKSVRPAVTLISGVTIIRGDGLKENPYRIG